MINNYVFRLLAQDSIDSTANAVLSDFRIRMGIPDLSADKLPPWAYTSLKTLLGETANSAVNGYGQPQWAVDRITDAKMQRKFQKVEDPPSLPLIYLDASNVVEDPQAQKRYRERGKLEIMVVTNPESAASSAAWNIMQRINSLFITHTASGIPIEKDIADGVSDIKGFLSLVVTYKGTPISAWDVQRSIYQTDAVVIK